MIYIDYIQYTTLGMHADRKLWLMDVSIFAQVNITNPTRRLDRFGVLSCYIHLQVNITKPKFSKWWLAVLWKSLIKKSEIKINSVPKTQYLCKNTKTIIRLLVHLSVVFYLLKLWFEERTQLYQFRGSYQRKIQHGSSGRQKCVVFALHAGTAKLEPQSLCHNGLSCDSMKIWLIAVPVERASLKGMCTHYFATKARKLQLSCCSDVYSTWQLYSLIYHKCTVVIRQYLEYVSNQNVF
jgi:hypothetical protein